MALALAILVSDPGKMMSSGSLRLVLLVGGAGMNAGLAAGGETGLLKSRFGLLKERVCAMGIFLSVLDSGNTTTKRAAQRSQNRYPGRTFILLCGVRRHARLSRTIEAGESKLLP